MEVAWYRKSFSLPADWQANATSAQPGKTVYLVFKGTQRSARVYLNGKEVAFHPLGYTEFVVRLDAGEDLQGSAVRCSVSIRNLHSGMPLIPTIAGLKPACL
jgi:hypothetical protein